MEVGNQIINHPNAKTLILEILNENVPFLYEAFSQLRIWPTTEETKKNLRKILEAYLTMQNNLCGISSYKEFLQNEETIYSAMDYIYRTLQEKDGTSFNASLVVLWIALERREEEFLEFQKDYLKENPSGLAEILTAFWLFNGFRYAYPYREKNKE